MYNFVCKYKNLDGFTVTMPVNGIEDINDVLNDEIVLGESLTIEKIDHNKVISEFFQWFSFITVGEWDIIEIDNRDVMNWLRYQDVDIWKAELVKQYLRERH